MIRMIKRGVVPSLFLFFFVLLNSFFVLGLGVSPGRVTLSYVPNYLYEGGACFGTHGIEHLELGTGGEFADNVKFLNSDDNQFYPAEQGCLKYTLKMPANIDTPGPHRTVIYATEIPEEVSGTIVAVVRVEHQIDIVVPYPGKYLVITGFVAQNSDAGATVPITVDLVNRGNETVMGVQGTVTIYDYQMNQIGSLKTSSAKNIEPEQTRQLTASWDSGNYKQGNYHAEVSLVYDTNTTSSKTDFKLGGLDVSLIDYSKEIIIGGIKLFTAVADSIWSETVTGVRAVVDVFNYTNSSQAITSFETLTRDIPPWGTENLRGYLDTTDLNLGVYDLKITLYFENLSKVYDKNLSIIKEPPKPGEKKSKSLWKTLGGVFTTKVMLILLGILLLLTLGVLIYVLLPKRKKEKEPKLK
jgi:hypothetical protein